MTGEPNQQELPWFLRDPRWIPLWIFLAVTALRLIDTIRQPIDHDIPLMLYEGMLINRFGYSPYVDFFEMNPPGTMILNQLTELFVQGSDIRYRLLDIIYTAILSLSMIFAAWPFGKIAGLFSGGCLVFYYTYLHHSLHFQREYLCLFPLLLAIGLSWRVTAESYLWKLVSMGVLCGLATTIKPPIAILFLPSCVFAVWNSLGDAPTIRRFIVNSLQLGGLFIGGMLAVWLVVTLYLISLGSLAAFWEMVSQYWPIYSELPGKYYGDTPYSVVLNYVITNATTDYIFVYFSIVGMLGGAGLSYSWEQKRTLYFLVAVLTMLLSLAYVIINGKLWHYQFHPYLACLSLLSGIVMTDLHWKEGFSKGAQALLLMLMLLWLEWSYGQNLFRFLDEGEYERNIKGGRVDVLTDFLRERLPDGESAQPMDVTDGGIHVLYRLELSLPTSFIYDFHLSHHVENPYIQELRSRFVTELQSSRPYFILDFPRAWETNQPPPPFPALETFLEANYFPLDDPRDEYFIVYQRKDSL